ncbi:hypothetical protein F4780DRAFT_779105 [Xylariomycetidae sp. FL0641]|nr:hypothetical protein F4780DRAFT_779105 [Xylariomycetidae sp. FL0641]
MATNTFFTPMESSQAEDELTDRTLAYLKKMIYDRLKDDFNKVKEQLTKPSLCPRAEEKFWEGQLEEHFQTVQRQLPQMLTDIIDGLKGPLKDKVAADSPRPRRPPPPINESGRLTPQPAPEPLPLSILMGHEPSSSPATRAPFARMDSESGAAIGYDPRSPTLAAGHDPYEVDELANPAVTPPITPQKRLLDGDGTTGSSAKRSKISQQDNRPWPPDRYTRQKFVPELPPNVWRFKNSQDGYQGLYCLCCDECPEPFYFTDNPFQYARAAKHFAEKHGRGDPRSIDPGQLFRSYAIKIPGAKKEGRVYGDHPNNKGAAASSGVGGRRTGSGFASGLNSWRLPGLRDKGKQPERPGNTGMNEPSTTRTAMPMNATETRGQWDRGTQDGDPLAAVNTAIHDKSSWPQPPGSPDTDIYGVSDTDDDGEDSSVVWVGETQQSREEGEIRETQESREEGEITDDEVRRLAGDAAYARSLSSRQKQYPLRRQNRPSYKEKPPLENEFAVY